MKVDNINQEDLDTAFELLWIHLQSTEEKANKSGGMYKHEVNQTYDFLNRVGYTKLRPSWEEKDWYFTFGADQSHEGKYHIIHGTYSDARRKMAERFDNKWCGQYGSADEASIDKYGYTEIK